MSNELSRNARMRQTRDRAAAIRAARVDALIDARASQTPVLSNILITPDTNPQFATLSDLESFLRHSNLTPALQEYIRNQNARNLSNVDSEACMSSTFVF